MYTKATNYIKHPVHPSWHAQSHHIKIMMGLKGTDKWPVDGLPEQQVQGFKVWVNPLTGEAPRNGAGYVSRRNTHRAMARCDVCGKTMSAGRTHQHICE